MAKALAMHGATVVIWGSKPEKKERGRQSRDFWQCVGVRAEEDLEHRVERN